MKRTLAAGSLLQVICICFSTAAIPTTCAGARVIAMASGNMGWQTQPDQIASSGSVSQSYERTLSYGSVTSRARASFGTLAVYAEAHNNDHR